MDGGDPDNKASDNESRPERPEQIAVRPTVGKSARSRVVSASNEGYGPATDRTTS
jgi:hypothetical protein